MDHELTINDAPQNLRCWLRQWLKRILRIVVNPSVRPTNVGFWLGNEKQHKLVEDVTQGKHNWQ